MQDYSVVEQNLRNLIRETERLDLDEDERGEKENVQSSNIPTNPFDKKMFSKKLRASRAEGDRKSASRVQIQRKPQRQESSKKLQKESSPHGSANKSRPILQPTNINPTSAAKRHKLLGQYLHQDLTQRLVNDNNQLFSDLIEYLMQLRDRTNEALKKQPLHRKDKEIQSEMILTASKQFFQQMFEGLLKGQELTRNGSGKAYPKHIETIIEFQTVQDQPPMEIHKTNPSGKKQLRNLPTNIIRETQDSSPQSSQVSYFRKSMTMCGHQTMESGIYNTQPNGRSLENTMCASRKSSQLPNKRSSVYETILKERKMKKK